MYALNSIATCSVALLLSLGCGKNPGAAPGQGAGQAASVPVESAISRVVTNFLEAVRRGDTNGASAQLTPLALRRINENNMTISPPASETAKFQVGTVEVIEGDKAIVESVWSDLDVDGQQYNQHTTWALRLGQGQWRISGMAEDMGPNQEPMIIDFENPAALAPPSQQGNNPSARQATQPADDPFQQGVNR